jgi:hypothetical protein
MSYTILVEFIYKTSCLKASGDPLDLTISYAKSKPYVIFFVIAFFAIKPLLIAVQSDDVYLRLVGVLIFVVSIYAGLALALERTTIRVVGRRLTVRHGPLPLLRGVKLDCGDVKVVHCEEKRVRAAHYYKLEAELLDQRRIKLLSPVPDVKDAQYVLTALRRWLEAAAILKS